jgi:Domain of unknown function (DUF4296)
MKYWLIALVVFLLTACKSNQPAIEQHKMGDILFDFFKADAFAREYTSVGEPALVPQKNVELQKQILKKYNVSKEDFFSSYKYYAQHSKLLTQMLDSVINKENAARAFRVAEEQAKFRNRATIGIMLNGFNGEPLGVVNSSYVKIPFARTNASVLY